MLTQNYRKGYSNPYRHGVLMGNFVEDIIGQDLKQNFEAESTQAQYSHNANPVYQSEKMDAFQWPQLKEQHIKYPGNDLTMKCNSNFDLNIDFTKKNIEDYLRLEEKNKYELNDKNIFLPGQIKAENDINNMTGMSNQKDINMETQNILKNYHVNDSRGVLFTKKSGLVKNLFFGHGDQRNFDKNEYSSTYK